MDDNFKKITLQEWLQMSEMEQSNYLMKASMRFINESEQTAKQENT